MKNTSTFNVFFLVSTFFIATAWAESPKKPGGAPFSDTSYVVPMEDEWVQKPIRHDPDLGDADVVISLDQNMYSFLHPLIKKYSTEQGLNIVTHKGTCGISGGSLRRKQVDIAGFCCPPGPTDRLPGLRYHTVGISSLAILVNADNPIDNITIEEAREIFGGQIHRWSELTTPENKPGPDFPISVITRLHCKTRPGHWRLLLDNEDLFSPTTLEVGTTFDIISTIAGDSWTIGYELLWNLKRYKKQDKLKLLKINGISPESRDHLIANDYPLYRSFNISTWSDEPAANVQAQKLVNYLLRQASNLAPELRLIPAAELKKNGWKFQEDELMGEP